MLSELKQACAAAATRRHGGGIKEFTKFIANKKIQDCFF